LLEQTTATAMPITDISSNSRVQLVNYCSS